MLHHCPKEFPALVEELDLPSLVQGNCIPNVHHKQYQPNIYNFSSTMSTFEFSISELTSNVQNPHEDIGFSELNDLLVSPASTSFQRNNRAIGFSASGQLKEAIQDLEESLETNHLNYAAYFNLFSIHMSNNNMEEALRNLCCGISCLYLLKAKLNKKEADINKALKYCENNVEARLIKSMSYFEKGKYPLALNEVNWAVEIQPNNERIKLIREVICKKMESEQSKKNEGEHKILQCSFPAFDEIPKRLRCTYYEDEEEEISLPEEITKKLTLFNELFAELNSDHISMIKKSPPVFMIGKPKQQKSIFTSLMIEEEREEGVNESYDLLGKEDVLQENGKQEEDRGEKRSEEVRGSHVADDNYSHVETYFMSNENDADSISRNNISLIPESSTTSYTIQALEDEKNLSIKVHKIDLSEMPQEQKNTYQHIYCRFEYGESQFHTNQTSNENQCWDRQFQTELEDEPQVLNISLFNKEIHAYKDRFIGLGAKEIITTGRLEVPVFKDQSRKQLIGKVFVDVRYK